MRPTTDDADGADDSTATRFDRRLDDIPQECRDLIGDFLREIEPLVSDIDWENATMADLERLGDVIEEPVSDMDVKMEQAPAATTRLRR